LVAIGAWRFFPPSEYIIGGKDPGTYFNEGIQIAQRGSLVIHDETVRDVPPDARDQFFPLSGVHEYQSLRFMGFWVRDIARGEVIGQFPHLYPASIAIGYGLDGLTGARRVAGWWAILGLVAVFVAGTRLVGRGAAFAGAVLLGLHVVTVFFAAYPNAEIVMQVLVFAGCLALARAWTDGDRAFGVIAAFTIGVLLFLRIDIVLAVAAVLATLAALALVDRRWPRGGFLVAFAPFAALAAWYYGTLMPGYSDRLLVYLANLPVAGTTAAAAGALVFAAVLWRASARHAPALRRALPLATLVVLTGAAVYAYWFRAPGGRLAAFDAYAFRTFVAFYLRPAGFLLAVAGLWLVVRDRFWRMPALVAVFSAFSLFIFYKIKIVPEHFWMARRFLPVILPVTLLMVAGAAFGPRVASASTAVSAARRAIGAVLVAWLGWQYAVAAQPLVRHVEYAGLIPYVEALAGRFGDRDLVLVESVDAGSDTHTLATPLAYIYARHALVLPNARPDKARLYAFIAEARQRYAHVYFLGGGGTDLLSRRIGATPVDGETIQVPEYASTPFDVYPDGVRRKDFHYSIYELTLDPPPSPALTIDIGDRDDLYVVRFHARERDDDRTVRWTSARSTISLVGLTGSEHEIVLTMHDGGRPAAAGPATVRLFWNTRPLATLTVTPGFHDYVVPIPADWIAEAARQDDPVQLRLDSSTWVPATYLGNSDTRQLGVMVDRVDVR
ncbi:MAG: hypothetical protein R2752_23870, partial [Vicinamibacterales bacterium]